MLVNFLVLFVYLCLSVWAGLCLFESFCYVCAYYKYVHVSMQNVSRGLLSAESAQIVFVEAIVSWFVYLCK